MLWRKTCWFLLKREEGKRHYVLIKFWYVHVWSILHRGRKHFCRYCLQAFSTEEIWKVILKTALKLMAKKWYNA